MDEARKEQVWKRHLQAVREATPELADYDQYELAEDLWGLAMEAAESIRRKREAQ